MTKRRTRWSAVAAILVIGCGGASAPQPLVVLAAASLNDSFVAIAEAFESQHPMVDIELVIGGSDQLARSILDGTPGQVFASADERQMGNVVEAGLVGSEPVIFATNRLAIVTPKGNPGDVSELEDLQKAELIVVVASPDVPIGAYTDQALGDAGVVVEPASLESDVRSVLTKVRLGEADAGVVYLTDVEAAGDDVEGFPIAPQITPRYPMALLEGASADASAFVEFVLSEDGEKLLAEFGFGPP